MKLTLSLLLLLLAYQDCHCQHRQRLLMTDLERLDLKSDIRSLTHFDFIPVKNLTDTSSLTIDHFFLAPNNYTITFNNSGYITKKVEYEYSNREDTINPKGIWTYAYDSLNRITQEVYYWNNLLNDTTILDYQYIGDSVTVVHDTYKHLTYRYAQRGKIEYSTKANSDSTYIARRLYVYDEHNRLVRREEYEDQSTITFLKSLNYTDSFSNNASLEVGISTKYNSRPLIIINEYDSLENLIHSKSIDDKTIRKIEYTYDSESNWIERRVLLPTGLIKISRRRITYF